MAAVTPNTNQARAMRVARKRIEGFSKQFGEAHRNLACHAAFPLVLTPDLLYQIWANFVPEAPWTAVAHMLLSRLCRQVGYEMYEMDIADRNLLLRELKEQFGQERLDELGEFLLDYVAQRLNGDDSDTQDLAQAQEWTASVYTKPDEAARELAEAITSRVKQGDMAEVFRLASLVETFAEPLVEAGFEPLLVYTSGMESFARGDLNRAETQFSKVRVPERQLWIAGVSLDLPPELAIVTDESEDKTGVPEKFARRRREGELKYPIDRASILSFIRRTLQQFRLESYYEPDEILHEAMLRQTQAIASGQIIKNSSAWLKSTCLNIVRECRRKQINSILVEDKLIYETAIRQIDNINTLEDINGIDAQKIRAALQYLDPSDRQILELRFFEDLSWQEISQRLSTQAGKVITAASLRKQGLRALHGLRQILSERLTLHREVELTVKLDPNTINELLELLRPFMEDEASRRPFLILALGNEAPVLQRISWSGAVATFIPDMVCKLAEYGEVAADRQALWVLLEYVRSHVGVDIQQRIDKLRPLIDLQAPSSTPPDTISSLTVEPGLVTKNLHDIPTANFNGCFIVDRLNYESLPNGSRVYSFDVFNKGYADGVIEVQNDRGELIEFRGIEGIRNSTNILGFGIQSIERLWRLATEGYEFLDPRNSLGNSQKTEIRNIVVPPEETLIITKQGNRALIYNQATFLLRLFLDHEAIFLGDSPSVKARLLSALCAKLQQEHIGSLVREGTLTTQSDALQGLITGRWIDKENLEKLTQIGLQALAEKGLKRISNIVINEQVLGKSLSFWTTSAEVFVKGANVFLQWLDLDRSQRAEEKTVTLFISERS